jgi:hypothetical protein
MSETEPFGHKTCDVPTYGHVWAQFRTSGYPRKLRREWDASGPDEMLAIVLRYVADWHVTDLAGALVENSGAAACLDNVEDAVVAWLTRSFIGFWLHELAVPRPNSLPPSAPT